MARKKNAGGDAGGKITAEFAGKKALVTVFEYKVYKACMRIPEGRTATYKDIAKMIGMPGSARAVGNALGKNPFAPHVPCHRVIKSDGTLGGYSGGGGLETKKMMLENERKKAGK